MFEKTWYIFGLGVVTLVTGLWSNMANDAPAEPRERLGAHEPHPDWRSVSERSPYIAERTLGESAMVRSWVVCERMAVRMIARTGRSVGARS
jgi:hypothetical protein